jgi:hypothetical protein
MFGNIFYQDWIISEMTKRSVLQATLNCKFFFYLFVLNFAERLKPCSIQQRSPLLRHVTPFYLELKGILDICPPLPYLLIYQPKKKNSADRPDSKLNT